MRKKRTDSKLGNLSEDEQLAVLDYSDQHTLYETSTWLLDQYGIPISLAALSTWLKLERQERAFDEHINRVAAARSRVLEAGDMLTAEERRLLGDNVLDGISQVLMDELADGGSAKSIAGLAKVILARRKQSLDEEKLKIEQVKAEKLELEIEELKRQREAAKDTAGDETLTPEQRERKFKEIFGIG